MKREKPQELLHKYIEGKCSPGEEEIVRAWYHSFDDDTHTELIDEEEQAKLRTRLMSSIRSNISSLDACEPPGARYIKKLTWRLAGIAAMLVMTAVYLFTRNNKPAEIGYQTPAIIKINNLTKTIQKVILTDGSLVWLNPRSILQYPEKFAGSQREVKMSGEAFFEISHDKNHPFIVHSGAVITRVLGTSFRIQAHDNVPTEVSVISGKVSVEIENKENYEVLITPNEKAVFVKENNILKKDREHTPSMQIWHKADMNFDNHPVRAVITKLNETFAVHITPSDDKLLDYVLTADFNDQNLPSILEMMSKSLNITYEINGRDIILNSR